MKKKLISVIIPCYNVEKYVGRCFSSLQTQTIGIDNLELIFVDDASTDDTWATLLAIESSCPDSVLIIHCDENHHSGAARNTGFQYASADYIAFMDADDWAEPDMYEKLYHCMMAYPCDLVRCHSIRDYGEAPLSPERRKTGEPNRLLTIDSIEKRKAFLLTDSIGTAAWDKLIRRNFLEENHISFPEDIAYEDQLWFTLLYLYATRVYILEENLYHYFINSESIVLKKDQNYHHDFLTVNLLKWTEWEKRGFFEFYKDELSCNFLLDCYLGYLKVLFLRFSQVPYSHFLKLKEEVLCRIPEYRRNPYLASCMTPLHQILLELLDRNISAPALEEIAMSARNIWLSVTIFTATHVRFDPPADPIYLPLHVGRAASRDLGYPGDDTGDNISLINCYYGELTGLYWIWKNYNQSDYVGLCHYRRYFLNDRHELMEKMDFIRILSSYDVIISKPVLDTKTCYERYAQAHNINDLLTIGDTIRKLFPKDYPFFEKAVYSHKNYCGNLFVAPKALFNQYADWLFTIFKKASQQIDTDSYDTYHKRVYGFLSEQLLYVWVTARGFTFYECDIGFTQEKAETVQLKQEIAFYFKQRNVKKAHQIFSSRMKERPDILLSGSDFNQELKTIYQIIHVCEKEALHGRTSLLDYSLEPDALIPHYLKLTEILSHMAAGSFPKDDQLYLQKTKVSKAALKAIIDVTPSYNSIDLNQWFWN